MFGVRTYVLSARWLTVNGMPFPMGRVEDGEFASSRDSAAAKGLLLREG